jgi:lipopolysaccharide biosynthesis glycosyltransferase
MPTPTDAAPKKIAVYIAGDSNIFFPGLVALNSIRIHNGHIPFDYFMFFEKDHLTPRMAELLETYGINFLDSTELDSFGSVEGMAVMAEKVWPAEVFNNWLAPMYFHEAGYEVAVKADYDLLCMAPYALADLAVTKETFASFTWSQNLTADGVTQETLIDLGVPPENTLGRLQYFNVGFVSINTSLYVERQVFERFKEIYSRLVGQSGKVKAAEQAAIALLCSVDNLLIRHIGKDYNVRATVLPDLAGDLMPKVRNIHFLTSNKPWKPVSFAYLSAYAKDDRAGLYMYRNIWLHEASKVDCFEEFVSQRPLTDLELLGLWTRVLGEVYAEKKALLK